MYVADLSPPSDPEDTVQLVSACEEFLCHFQPIKSAAEEERDSQPTSLASHPDRSLKSNIKTWSTHYNKLASFELKDSVQKILCDRDMSVVESKASSRKGRRKGSFTHHLDSTLVRGMDKKRDNLTCWLLHRLHPMKQCSAA